MSTFYTDSGSFNDISTTGSTLISGSLVVSGTISFPTIGSSTRPNFVSIDIISGQLYYASTSSFTAATASYVTASNVYGPFGTNSIQSASYSSGSTSASYASSSTSASYSQTSSYITGSIHTSANPALSASYASSSTSASYASSSTSASYASSSTSASYASSSTSASYALTSSYALNVASTFPYTGNAVITGSLLISGSGLTITGSVNISGSLNATASWAISASQAITASYITGSIHTSANPALSASYASSSTSASYASSSTSASYASSSTSASYAFSSTSASYASSSTSASYASGSTSASYAQTASQVENGRANYHTLWQTATRLTSSAAIYENSGFIGIGKTTPSTILDVNGTTTLSGSVNITGSTTIKGFTVISASLSVSGAIAVTSIPNLSTPYFISYNLSDGQFYYASTSSFTAATASFVTASNVWGPFGTSSILSASYAFGSTSASYASSSTSASYASSSTSASYASSSTSASYAATASNVLGGRANYIALWSGSNTTLSSSAVLYETNNRIGIGYTSPDVILHISRSGQIFIPIGDSALGASLSTGLLLGGNINPNNWTSSLGPEALIGVANGNGVGPGGVNGDLLLSTRFHPTNIQAIRFIYSASSATNPYTFYRTSAQLTGSILISGSINLSGSLTVNGIAQTSQANFLAYNTNGTVTYASTSSFTAATASNVQGGQDRYITRWIGATALTRSIVYETSDSAIIINYDGINQGTIGKLRISGSIGIIGDGNQIGPSTAGSTLDFIGTKLTISGSTFLSGSTSLTGSLSVLGIAQTSQANFLAYNTNGTVTYASTSSFTASYAQTASQVENGRANYMTLWQTATRLTSSTALFEAADGKLLLGRGLTTAVTNGDVQISGSLGVGAAAGTSSIRSANNSDTSYLRLIANEVWLSGTQGGAAAYADGAKLGIVVNSASTLLSDIGWRAANGNVGRFRVNTESNTGQLNMQLSSSLGTSFVAKTNGGVNNSGSVGIGILNGSPTSTLHVSGTVELDGLANTNQANFLAYDSSTGNVTYASTSSLIASSSYPITVTGSTIYSTGPAAVVPGTGLASAIILGSSAGPPSSTTSIDSPSVAIGNSAGNSSGKAGVSVFIGQGAGASSTSNSGSVMIGNYAGNGATNGNFAIVIGNSAGTATTNINNTVLVGYAAGSGATTSTGSVIIGYNAGEQATKAANSLLIGYQAGQASLGSGSTFIGYQAGKLSPGNNSIAIGSNVNTSGDGSINIGGVIFGTGSYSGATPSSGSVGTAGKVGIGLSTPSTTLHVSGTVTITGDSASFVAPAPPNTQVNIGGTTSAPSWRGLSGKITPTKSGRVFAMFTTHHSFASSITTTFKLFCSSSATAPSVGTTNASIPTGSAIQIGSEIQATIPNTGYMTPVALQGLITLTVGTTYWFDVFTTNTSTLYSGSLTVFEI